MVEDVREEGSAGTTVGVQKTEQIRLIRRRSAKAYPLARPMTVQRDTCVHGGGFVTHGRNSEMRVAFNVWYPKNDVRQFASESSSRSGEMFLMSRSVKRGPRRASFIVGLSMNGN